MSKHQLFSGGLRKSDDKEHGVVKNDHFKAYTTAASVIHIINVKQSSLLRGCWKPNQ